MIRELNYLINTVAGAVGLHRETPDHPAEEYIMFVSG